MTSKQQLRDVSSSLLASMDNSVLLGESSLIDDMFLHHFGDYQSYFIYLDYRREVPTGGIISRLLGLGRKVYVPVIDGDSMGCVAYYGTDRHTMQTNRFGILEPVSSGGSSCFAGKVEVEKDISMDVIVAPCVACDAFGNRLGRGKGYYDRALQNFSGVSVCLAYSFQVRLDEALKAITEPHDAAVTYVLTNKKIYGGLKPA